MAGFQELFTSIKKRDNKETAQADVQKEDVYLPEFYSYDLTYHVVGFIFTLPKGNHLHNFLTPKDNLINETTPETIKLFSKNIFKILQETLIKTAIDNYIKELTFSFVNESYFLYDKSNMTKQTLITKIKKMISVYGSISYFHKKSINEAVEIPTGQIYFRGIFVEHSHDTFPEYSEKFPYEIPGNIPK